MKYPNWRRICYSRINTGLFSFSTYFMPFLASSGRNQRARSPRPTFILAQQEYQLTNNQLVGQLFPASSQNTAEKLYDPQCFSCVTFCSFPADPRRQVYISFPARAVLDWKTFAEAKERTHIFSSRRGAQCLYTYYSTALRHGVFTQAPPCDSRV